MVVVFEQAPSLEHPYTESTPRETREAEMLYPVKYHLINDFSPQWCFLLDHYCVSSIRVSIRRCCKRWYVASLW